MTVVEAKRFHPMLGHVDDGNVVVFSDGRRLTTKGDSAGWSLVDGNGKRVAGPADGADALTRLIVKRDEGGL